MERPPIATQRPVTTSMGASEYALLMAGERPTDEQLAKLADTIGVAPETVERWFDWTEAERVLTVEECAELLSVGERTIYEVLRSGELKGRKVGRRWVTTSAYLLDFVKAGAEGA